MKNVVIGIVGKDNDVSEMLFKGFKKFYPDKLELLIKENSTSNTKKIIKNLEQFGIEIETSQISSDAHLEEIFLSIKQISEKYTSHKLIINVETDYETSCLALSSAFVNGIQAIGILNDKIIAYPIMKFSYYNAINEKKLELLTIINKKQILNSMEELSKLAKISLPLIAYHLKGNKDSQGLIDMNLVETERIDGKLQLTLSDLGKLIVSGSLTCKRKLKPKSFI
jgi:hypothetical protein